MATMSFCSNWSSSTIIPQALDPFEPPAPESFLPPENILSAAVLDLCYDDDDPFWDPNQFQLLYDYDQSSSGSCYVHDQYSFLPIIHESKVDSSSSSSSSFHNGLSSYYYQHGHGHGHGHGQICAAASNCCSAGGGGIFFPDSLGLINCYDQIQVPPVVLGHPQAANTICGDSHGNSSSSSSIVKYANIVTVVEREHVQQHCSNGGGGGGGSLSAQSLAARERRRRITEKTQQLAKLIPGAHKMNTADMFQAGFKYVKFLQAQLAILQFTHSTHHQEELEEEKVFGVGGSAEELQFLLLDCPSVQEKLYSQERCLVPAELLENIIRSSSSGGGGEVKLQLDI
ncbi:hypothetical protein Dimus_000253 [Dionaea muscipula]